MKPKPKVPLELIDSRDGHLGLVAQFWDGFATTAWQGYLQGGRGAVLLDLSEATDMDIDADSIEPLIEYLALNSDVDFGEEPFKSLKVQLEDYDPEKEIMVLVYRRTFNIDGESLRTAYRTASNCLHQRYTRSTTKKHWRNPKIRSTENCNLAEGPSCADGVRLTHEKSIYGPAIQTFLATL
jgi:hypothetical protein